MPRNETEIKPLDSNQIRAQMILAGVTGAEIARRVEKKTGRPCPRENVSRVINRTEGFWFPEIIRELARAIKVEESQIGRAPSEPQRKRARTLARKSKVEPARAA
ncbi:MAG: hypothetical protein AUG51_09415 [Acidobacteria bacterium 13_1_20CM_3_53_8]|nr:MAG: hypothetical protein AUG51_09415 [Acidobacteria bacterium 13_1_20CM_3_53_8]